MSTPYTHTAPQSAPAPSSAPRAGYPSSATRHAGLPDGVTYLHGVMLDTRPFVTYDPTRATPDYLYTPSPRASEMGGAL